MPSYSALLILALVVLIAVIAFFAITCGGQPSPVPPPPDETTNVTEDTASPGEATATAPLETTETTLPATSGPEGR